MALNEHPQQRLWTAKSKTNLCQIDPKSGSAEPMPVISVW